MRPFIYSRSIELRPDVRLAMGQEKDIMCAMYHSRLLHAAFGIAGLAALLAQAHPAAAQADSKWIVTEISGQVHDQGVSGTSPSLARGSVLEEGRTVETGADARLVLMHGKDLVTVSPNSEFRIPPSTDPGERVNFIQTLGTMLYRVEHLPERGFEVDTPALAAVVKGTVFTVTAGKDADSVHVAGGAVQVTSLVGHEIALVHPGEVAVVSSAGRDLTILGTPASGKTLQRRSEYKDPDDEALGASTSAAAPAGDGARGAPQAGPRLTRVMGEEHLNIPAVTKGLLGDGKAGGHALYFATAGSSDNQDTPAATANPNAAGGNANAAGGNANAIGGNANAMSGNPNAMGGNANAMGGNPNAMGANPNAQTGNLNAAVDNLNGLIHGHGKK